MLRSLIDPWLRYGLAGSLADQELLEFADILHFGQLIALEPNSERLFDAEHQIDMGHGVPAFDIGCRHLIGQREALIVEHLAKHFFESIVQLHSFPQLSVL